MPKNVTKVVYKPDKSTDEFIIIVNPVEVITSVSIPDGGL